MVTVTTRPTSDFQITVSPPVRDCQSDGINGSGGCFPNKKFTDTLGRAVLVVPATIKELSGHWLTGHWSLATGLTNQCDGDEDDQ